MHYIAQSLVTLNHRAAYLVWDSVTDSDLTGYNIYGAQMEPTSFKKLNTKLLTRPEYSTEPMRNDVVYFFRVSSVDTAGNESELSDILEFRLLDYKEDPDLVLVQPERNIIVKSGNQSNVDLHYGDFMTRFTYV